MIERGCKGGINDIDEICLYRCSGNRPQHRWPCCGTDREKGDDAYVTHFIFMPVKGIDIPGLGTATLLEVSARLKT